MLSALRCRLQLSGLIIVLYFFSTLLLSVYPEISFKKSVYGLFIASSGSICIFLLLRQWEKSQTKPHFHPPLNAKKETTKNPIEHLESVHELEQILNEAQNKNIELIQKQNVLEEALHKLENEKAQFEQKIKDIHHQLASKSSEADEELRRKTTLLSEYQETINQQREVIQKKQDQTNELETKVRDLKYEVKTLLQLAEINSNDKKRNTNHSDQKDEKISDSPIHYTAAIVKSPEEASLHLGKCIDIAQKITSSNRFNNGSSRFQHMPLDNSALDFRRLFDSLRSEVSSGVIVYSLKENRLIFANNQIHSMLGWDPERFTQHFSEIIREGYEDWNHALCRLSPSSETKARLLLKTNNGQNLLVNCHLKMIPTGIFRHYVIGILYPA